MYIFIFSLDCLSQVLQKRLFLNGVIGETSVFSLYQLNVEFDLSYLLLVADNLIYFVLVIHELLQLVLRESAQEWHEIITDAAVVRARI